MNVVWAPEALAEVARIYDHVGDFDPAAAMRLVVSLRAAGDALATFTHRGRIAGDGLRELASIHPYIIRYEVMHDTVHILRVRHGMRLQ